jgi:2-dehydro-3-deoxyphosphooctonate aldolase (KDO 8-P synthase)
MNTFIIGPCSLETYELSHKVLSTVYPYLEDKEFYFKGSFDKANRTSITGQRGPGLKEGLEIFKQLKKDFPGLKVTTDVHETAQVEKLADTIDVIQIPAFLCRQTDLLVESARHFNIVNIKKGQWMNPQNMAKGIDKLKVTNPECKVWLTERGTAFGYSQFIVDFSSVDFFKEHFDKVIMDCTHAAQLPKPNGRMSGNPTLAARYFQAAGIFGYTGVFAEAHPTPSLSYSDADSVLPLEKMVELLKNV